MKKLFSLQFLLMCVIISQAQNYDFQWSSDQFGNVLPNGIQLDTITGPRKSTTEYSAGIAEDHNGDIITVSHFKGSYLTFPPLNRFYESNGGTIALQKRDKNGDILWNNWIDGGDYSIPGAKRIVNDVAIDSQNDIYICGYINDTTDFDTDTSETLGLSPSVFTGYIAKYDANGNFQWLYQLSGANDCSPTHIEVDQNDDVIVYGLYRGTLDFDAGADSAFESSFLNRDDLFLLKLDSVGNYVWHNVWGSSSTDDPTGLALDNQGNIHIASGYGGALDSDPGPDTNVIVSGGGGSFNVNAYVSKFANDGSWLWSSEFDCSNTTWIYDIACDGESICVVGDFDGTLTVGHSGTNSTVPQASAGNYNITLIKLDTAGQFEWDYQPEELSGGMSSFGYEIGYHDKNWLVAFSSYDDMDLDNGPGVDSIGTNDRTEYLVQVDTGGNYLEHMRFNMDDRGFVELHEIAGNGRGLYLVGHYEDATLDVNPDSIEDEILPLNYLSTFFVTKLSSTCPNVTYDTIAPIACSGYTSPSGNTIWDSTGTYSDIIPNAGGCDSMITVNLTILNPTFSTDSITTCDSLTWINGITYTSSNNTATDTLINAAGCDSVVTLNLTILNSTSSIDTVAACNSYSWSSNGMLYTSSGIYSDTLTAANGCDSISSIDLTINLSSFATINVTSCDSYMWLQNGTTYFISGMYKDTISNATGCDSIITLDLTINTTVRDTNIVVSCDAYTWMSNGQMYAASGIYSDTLTAANGCDSISSIDLTINSSSSAIISVSSCDSYSWIQNGVTYTMSGMYKDTISNTSGCDSIITLDLTINTTVRDTNAVIACDAYSWMSNGQVYTASGIYSDTLTAANGCDSISSIDLTINMPTSNTISVSSCDGYMWLQNGMIYFMSGMYEDTISNANGCDSIITLDLTINTTVRDTNRVISCDAYTWTSNGKMYTTSGIYSDTLTAANGCDSISSIDLTINLSTSTAVRVTSCDSYMWIQNGVTYTLSGMYKDTISNSSGCDSIITLDLTINSTVRDTNTVIACDTYTWMSNGQMYTAGGIYSDTLTAVNGCDSISSIDLTINLSTSAIISVTSCDSYMWIQNGVTYTVSGMYKDTISNANGCDSIITLDLTINTTVRDTNQVIACDTYTWMSNGQMYTASGIYSDTLTATNGCDSINSIDLTINLSASTTVRVTSCDSYMWIQNGMTYTLSGMYSDTTSSTTGCDSIINLDLTINYTNRDTLVIDTNPSYFWKGRNYFITGYASDTLQNNKGCDSISVLNLTITDTTIINTGDSLFFNQSSSSPTVTYQWVDCDSGYAIIPGATSRGFKPGKPGNYAIIITDGGVSDTSACIRTIITTIKEYPSNIAFRVYPNPSRNFIVIEKIEGFNENSLIRIFDIRGRFITEKQATSNKTKVDLSYLNNGVYIIEVENYRKKIILNR